MTGSVRLLVEPLPGKSKVKIFASRSNIRPKIVHVDTPQELYAEYRLYKMWVVRDLGIQVDVIVPNCYGAFMASRLVIPKPAPPVLYCSLCGGQATTPFDMKAMAHQKCLDGQYEKFEVNMVEALVGWKGWSLSKKDKLIMTTYESLWYPDQFLQATCGNKRCNVNICPNEDCSCGIYAADTPERTHQGKDRIQGQIYGWGRYVRAESGWRSQYAYPKSFILREDQAELIDDLKKYHVPIYVTQPMKMYSPEEDGYQGEDDGNWEAEEDRSGGAGEEPDAS